jgi:glycosyltransferase involved in cell wall biosynthesis
VQAKLENSLRRVAAWIEAHDCKAYDPGDGQLSFLRHFALGQPFLRRLLTAFVLRAPFNIRPWIGIRPHVSTKGMGYLAWGYCKRYARTKDDRFATRARACLDWLVEHRAPGYQQPCWGNHFAFTTRGGTIPALEPTIVWSSLIGQAFLEAHRVFGEARYLEVASGICDWIQALPREATPTGSCISYVAFEQSSIHNSNMLGAALLAQVGSLTGDAKALEVARQAMTYSCARLNPDGSWFYGENPKYHWIDCFHTGYNLDSLKRYRDSSGDRSFDGQMRRGFAYFKQRFFEPTGRPKYYHDRVYPIDIQCAAQAIDTLTLFAGEDAAALDLARKVAGWTIDNMQANDGHFYYRDLGWAVNKTPMLHWGQGTMFKALSHLLSQAGPGAKEPQAEPASTGLGLRIEAATPKPRLKYVLVTPARNEEEFLQDTIRSVALQTVRPAKWIIVSDGSTDRTDEIVKCQAAQHDWIELLRMPEHRDRQFAAKAHAFNAGFARLKGTDYDFIGNLDADITFEPDYFRFLLDKFGENPKLGVAGTPFVEYSDPRDHHGYAHQFAQLEHVSGACQLFRKECFEQVGGYVPIKGGAIDWIAVTTARMKGWETRTFLEKSCLHHRKLGTGTDSPLMVRFRYGQKAYYVGGHPLWECLRGFFQMRQKPFVVGGAYFLSGFLWAAFIRMKRPVSAELMNFHRAEQMARLGRCLPFLRPRKGARRPLGLCDG